MDDITLLEAVERYISGSMGPDERVYFEGLRKTNPEIDQLVVEHTFFMQQLHRFDDTKKLKAQLDEVHLDLTENGQIAAPRLNGKARVVYLFHRYKRTAAIAASIAGITAVAISALVSSIAPVKQSPAHDAQYQYLKGKVEQAINENKAQNKAIKEVINKVDATAVATPSIVYTTGGTGFLIGVNGYLVTSAHVIENASNIVVQNSAGEDLSVRVIQTDTERDIAILKIEDARFKAPSSLPYIIRRSSAEMAEPVFTLGYPRNVAVYGEGYMAASTGYNGDTLTCQIAIAANPGNSGGPILNRNGEVVGILSARQTTAEGVVFATQSKYIYNVLAQLRKSDSSVHVKLPTAARLQGLGRPQQVKKITDFVYMVKVS